MCWHAIVTDGIFSMSRSLNWCIMGLGATLVTSPLLGLWSVSHWPCKRGSRSGRALGGSCRMSGRRCRSPWRAWTEASASGRSPWHCWSCRSAKIREELACHQFITSNLQALPDYYNSIRDTALLLNLFRNKTKNLGKLGCLQIL
jgi:hypothetical protein